MMKYPMIKFQLESWITLAVLILVEAERPKFRDDYRYEKGFDAFYKVHHVAVPWRQARARCAGEGAALLAPAHLDEADAMPLLIATIQNHYKGIFIGIHDLYAERIFATIKGFPVVDSFLNLLWENEEPAQGRGRCLVMHHNGLLRVHPCEDSLPFICKVKASDIKYYRECDTFDPRWKLGPNATCYLMHTDPQRWYDAYGTCLAAGGHLAIMNSRGEAEHVRSLLRQVPERRVPDNDIAFLGFSDLFQRYHFRTIQGQRINDSGYADWAVSCGKATNRSFANRCGALRRSGLLALADCGVPAMFICEKGTTSAESVKPKPTIEGKDHKRMGAENGIFPTSTLSRTAPSTSTKNTTLANKSATASVYVTSSIKKATKSLTELTQTVSYLTATRTILENQTEVTAPIERLTNNKR